MRGSGKEQLPKHIQRLLSSATVDESGDTVVPGTYIVKSIDGRAHPIEGRSRRAEGRTSPRSASVANARQLARELLEHKRKNA